MGKIIDFLFPPICPICGAPCDAHGMMCAACWATFNWIGNPRCHICGYPFAADLDLGPHPMCPVCAAGKNEIHWMRSACVYDDVSRNIMLPFKHAGRIKYRHIMARAMIGLLGDMPATPDLVMPVPLAWGRLFHRGYNQATLLARPIARHLNIAIDINSVRRKYRSDMGHKSARERAEHIHGVFCVVHPDAVRGKTILLVDDVFTSGATFSELRRVLMRAGARDVWGVTFCRVVHAI